jgi:hypothetical protein
VTTAELHPLVRAWADSGFEELTLSNGLRIRLRPVSPAQLITSGLLPYDLIGAIVDAEEKGEQLSDDVVGRATLAYLGKEQQLAARSVQDVWNGETWESIEIPAEVFADGRTFPPEDVEAITELAMSRIRASAGPGGRGDVRPGHVSW